MVASISAIQNPGNAASYFEQDDGGYYAEGGRAPSAWIGSGAEELGLTGLVNREDFEKLLNGELPNGIRLGTMRGGIWEHSPGLDLTFSPSKSVSILALVAGDERLIAAHDAAVLSATKYAQEHTAETRIRGADGIHNEKTSSIVSASFRHETSRALSPQMHTHVVILNATQSIDGKWRSLYGRPFFQDLKTLSQIYSSELALRVRELGYSIEVGKHGNFEIVGVPAELISEFSERSAAVERRLAEIGLTRESASRRQREVAALESRDAKQTSDRAELLSGWRERAASLGFSHKARQQLVETARALSADKSRGLCIEGEAEAFALRAVQLAASSLGERQSVIKRADLEREAAKFSTGKSGLRHIQQAVEKALSQGEFVARTFIERRGTEVEGVATKANVEFERRMLKVESLGRGEFQPLATAFEAAKAIARSGRLSDALGLHWTADQREATQAVLMSRSRVVGVQGLAGTGKTSTVLSTVVTVAREVGYAVRALAPSASAARTLSEALNLPGQTVARHLNLLEQDQIATNPKGEMWIVDEASLLGARDMARLLEGADKIGARVLLSGDRHQLGAVAAGVAFEQLQDAGMQTAKLTAIIRQTNPKTLEAVEASLFKSARQVLDALDHGGGRVTVAETTEERRGKIAVAYADLNQQARAQTLVIDPSREGREALSEAIRSELLRRGELGEEAVRFDALVSRDLSLTETKLASSYEPNDVVVFSKRVASEGISRGTAFTVSEVDESEGVVRLIGANGRVINWRPDRWGEVDAFSKQARELRTGDLIEFIRNDHALGRVNGQQAEVSSVDPKNLSATIQFRSGSTVKLDLDSFRDAHIRHAFVSTAHAAQGKTADRVLVHMESGRGNLIDQTLLYVAISRARGEAVIVTDNRDKLLSAITERAGAKQTALEIRAERGQGAVVEMGL